MRGGQPEDRLAVVVLARPLEGGSEIVGLGVGEAQPVEVGDHVGQARTRAEELAVSTPRGVGLAGLGEPVGGVLADGLQEAVANDGGLVRHRVQQRLVRQSAQHAEDVAAGRTGHRPGCRRCRFGRLEAEVAREDREPTQHDAFGLGQQVVAPVQHRAKRSVARVRPARACHQDSKPVVEAVGQRVCTQDAHARRGHFQGQGDAVETAADPGHGGGIGFVENESTRGLAGPFAEQPYGVGVGQLCRVVPGRKGQRAERVQVLAGDGQGLAAGRQDQYLGTAGQHRPGQVGGGVDEMLPVVQDDQQPAVLELLAQGVGEGPAGPGHRARVETQSGGTRR